MKGLAETPLTKKGLAFSLPVSTKNTENLRTQQVAVELVMVSLHAEFILLNHQTWEIPAMNELIVNYVS